MTGSHPFFSGSPDDFSYRPDEVARVEEQLRQQQLERLNRIKEINALYAEADRRTDLPPGWFIPAHNLSLRLPEWGRADETLAGLSRPLLSWPREMHATVRFPVEGVTVWFDHPGYGGTVRCSCDQPDCAHGAAALRAILTEQSARDWRPAMDSLMTTGNDHIAPLGLVFSVHVHAMGASVVLRPGLRTKKGGWNKTVAWRDVMSGHRGTRFDPDQVNLVLSHLPRLPLYDRVPIDALNPRLWDLIRAAGEAGVVVDTEDERGRMGVVSIRPDAGLAIVPTLVRDGGLELRPEVVAPWQPDDYAFFGQPPHSVLAQVEGGLVLAPVDCDPVAARLVEDGPLEIPDSEADVFVRDFLPGLRERTRIVVQTADESGPVVLVAVYAGRGAEGAALTWWWDRDGERRPFGDAAPGRDPLREELRARLLDDHPALGGWIAPGERVLDPVESCVFGLEVAPLLEADPETVLEVVGDALAYAPADDTQIVWDVDDTDDRDWFDLAVELSVDGTPVPMAVLIRSLATGQDLLVLDDGRYVDLRTDEMDRLRDLLREAAAFEVDERVRVARQRLDLWERLQELGESRQQAPGWTERVGALTGSDRRELEAPEPIQAILRDYQLEGFRWLTARWDAGMGGILADDMGLGKTLQVLSAIARRRAHGEPPVLIVAPRSVLRTWVDQARAFAPSLTVHMITSKLGDANPVAGDPDVVVTSHHLLRLDAEAYAAHLWSGVVIDEAQAVKNPATRLHRAIRRLDRSFTVAVTGTPVENSLVDVWSLMELVAPGALPPLKEFNQTIRRPIETDRDSGALQALRRRLSPFILRRTKDQVATELPPKIEQVVAIELGRDDALRYRKLLDRERQVVLGLLADDEGRNKVEILASLMRLRKLAGNLGEPDRPSEKASYLLEQLGELREEGHRVLVFSQFTSHLAVLREQLTAAGLTHDYLDGSTLGRDQVIDRFRAGGSDVFLISLKAGGVGITLTEADYVFLLDPWWNPAVESQAVDRTHRIGQTKPVNVYRLVSADTIEEKVVRLQDGKKALADNLLSGEGTAMLDPDEIRRLLAEG
ncbi:DEAD/DEAH box helicase [Mariniluteicoccus flavus]